MNNCTDFKMSMGDGMSVENSCCKSNLCNYDSLFGSSSSFIVLHANHFLILFLLNFDNYLVYFNI
jgi:hypothetical protein